MPHPPGTRCPNGHRIGKVWKTGLACSAVECGRTVNKQVLKAAEAAAKQRSEAKSIADIMAERRARANEIKAATEAVFEAAEEAEAAKEIRRLHDSAPPEMKAAHDLFLHRVRAAKMPSISTTEEAVAWSQEKLVKMLPDAVAELQHQLRYGNSKERAAAVDVVLRANGVAQKDAAAGTTPTILISLGTDAMSAVPFLQRFQSAKKDDDK